jgi:hypothetical protein
MITSTGFEGPKTFDFERARSLKDAAGAVIKRFQKVLKDFQSRRKVIHLATYVDSEAFL